MFNLSLGHKCGQLKNPKKYSIITSNNGKCSNSKCRTVGRTDRFEYLTGIETTAKKQTHVKKFAYISNSCHSKLHTIS